MSAIINAGESLSLEQKASIAQTKSQSGRRVAQKRGPTLYNLEVEIGTRRIGDTTHQNIEDEIIDLAYGAETFNSANISGTLHTSITGVRNGWTAATLVSATGTSVVLSGVTGTPTKGDFFQLNGSTKVFQVSSYDGGSTTITANSAVIGSSTSITIGDQVSFNFALVKRPRSSYLPGNLVQYGTFVFEEVIE